MSMTVQMMMMSVLMVFIFYITLVYSNICCFNDLFGACAIENLLGLTTVLLFAAHANLYTEAVQRPQFSTSEFILPDDVEVHLAPNGKVLQVSQDGDNLPDLQIENENVLPDRHPQKAYREKSHGGMDENRQKGCSFSRISSRLGDSKRSMSYRNRRGKSSASKAKRIVEHLPERLLDDAALSASYDYQIIYCQNNKTKTQNDIIKRDARQQSFMNTGRIRNRAHSHRSFTLFRGLLELFKIGLALGICLFVYRLVKSYQSNKYNLDRKKLTELEENRDALINKYISLEASFKHQQQLMKNLNRFKLDLSFVVSWNGQFLRAIADAKISLSNLERSNELVLHKLREFIQRNELVNLYNTNDSPGIPLLLNIIQYSLELPSVCKEALADLENQFVQVCAGDELVLRKELFDILPPVWTAMNNLKLTARSLQETPVNIQQCLSCINAVECSHDRSQINDSEDCIPAFKESTDFTDQDSLEKDRELGPEIINFFSSKNLNNWTRSTKSAVKAINFVASVLRSIEINAFMKEVYAHGSENYKNYISKMETTTHSLERKIAMIERKISYIELRM